MPLDPSDLLVGQITADDIKEFVHGTTSPRADNFTLGGCDLEMKFQIPGDKLKAALQWILGVDYVDTNHDLRRSLPMFHPVHNWAWARSVTAQGQQYDGDDTDAVVWDFQSTPAKWKKYEVTVSFDIPRFRVLGDDEVQYEYQRFVSKELTPDTKIVTVENGQVLYDANGGDDWNGKPHQATIPIARRDGGGLTVKWWHVPADFVQPDDNTVPVKYLNAQGKVNSASIFGCDAETLLLVQTKFEKYVSPLLTDQLGRLQYLYDIEFEFLYVRQLDASIGKAGETRRGHNMLLGPTMKYWYAKNATSNNPVFESVDFAKLFTYYTDTIS